MFSEILIDKAAATGEKQPDGEAKVPASEAKKPDNRDDFDPFVDDLKPEIKPFGIEADWVDVDDNSDESGKGMYE